MTQGRVSHPKLNPRIQEMLVDRRRLKQVHQEERMYIDHIWVKQSSINWWLNETLKTDLIHSASRENVSTDEEQLFFNEQLYSSNKIGPIISVSILIKCIHLLYLSIILSLSIILQISKIFSLQFITHYNNTIIHKLYDVLIKDSNYKFFVYVSIVLYNKHF